MALLALTRTQWIETGVAGGIFVAALVLAIVIAAAARRVIHHYTRGAGMELDDLVVGALRGPAAALVVVQGVALALGSLSYLDRDAALVRRLWLAATLAICVLATQRGLAHLMQWYAGRTASDRGPRLDPRTQPLLRRLVNVVIWLAGGLVVLDTLGIQISPLLAGLGIGGIAVALALQPLLVNIFASSYMLSDQSIRVGDVVEMRGGPSGAIEDIGWRATRIRSADNHIVIVPNATLAGAIVTNYHAGDRQSDARVTLEVAYGADLARVEAVCLEEMTRLRDELEFAVKDATPLCRYQGFEDAGIGVLLKLRVRSWEDAALLRHLLIMRIDARFRVEGIAIGRPPRAAEAAALERPGGDG